MVCFAQRCFFAVFITVDTVRSLVPHVKTEPNNPGQPIDQSSFTQCCYVGVLRLVLLFTLDIFEMDCF